MAGNIVHFEINAKDANRAKRFYTSLFGWKYKDSEMPGIEYYVIDGASPGGAINPMQGDPGPVVYFDTDDIDASIAKVRDLGGKSDDKMAIPAQGWFAPCVDTEGNKFSLFQSDPSVTVETEQQTARA
ncbi:MAG TPA: VOC family protein [Candidatus Limnocylindria bacterium]